jgi:Carboxypeptidase regulatory-like domain/TonB-dependent Receptor Plug Domain/TonB dependent receptor
MKPSLTAIFLLLTVPAWGQIGGGSIVGVVTDGSGAVVPGAQVTALNTATNESQSVRTNDSGYYEFPLLPAGQYRLAAEATGFQKLLGKNFDLNTGSRPRIDLQLKVGNVSETVQVEATVPLVNATTSELGAVVSRSRLEDLPLNGRNFQQLLNLQAGVVNAPASGAGRRGGMEFHGSSALGNKLMLDGVDMSFGEENGAANFASAGGGGVLINTVSVEAIQEFRATGSSFSAEYGGSGGGVLNITTRSGSNEFHGALFEYFRNDALDANDFFSNKNGTLKPPLRWNQYGGNLGGPIRRDKAFFFFNYEGDQVHRLQAVNGNTVTPQLLNAVNPAIRQALITYLPSTYTPTTNPYLGFHRRNDHQRNADNTYLTRIDGDLGRHRLSMRDSYNHQDYSVPTFAPAMPRVFPLRFHNVVLQDSWSVASSALNELRAGFNRVDLNRSEIGRDQMPAWISVSGAGFNASQLSYIHFISNTYTLTDNFSVIHRAHTFKMGFELREVRSARIQGGQPAHQYNSLNDLIADRPARIQVLFGGGKSLRTRHNGFYLQDDWRISPRFQINVGLRYEYTPPLTGGFNIATSDPFGRFIERGQPMFAPDRNDFAPRLGLVWDPSGNQKTVIRAGASIGYIMPQALYYYDMAFIDPQLPFVANFAPSDVPPQYRSYPLPQTFVDQVAANPALLPRNFVLSRSVADFNRRDTYAGQWNLAVQHAMTPSLAVQAAYVGSRTVKLISARALNLVDPVTGKRPDARFGDINFEENAANISYHALEITVNKRLSHGLSFDAFYTWSKSIGYYVPDNTVVFTNDAVQDSNNIAGSKGPKDGTIGHRLTGVLSYVLPYGMHGRKSFTGSLLGGWNVQSIIGWRSGLPLNVTSNIDAVGNGRAAGQRPDPVPGVDPYNRNPGALIWLNRAAFDLASPKAQRRFGYLGYNSLIGPTAFTMDLGLHKTFYITERQQVTFRAEAFNWLNHTTFGSPVTNVSDPNFGTIRSADSPRNVQLALKYRF